MNRLFLKIFLGFWLTFLLAAIAIGGIAYFYHQAALKDSDDIAEGPRARQAVAYVSTLLELGGKPAFNEFMRRRHHKGKAAVVLAVDKDGDDILGRPVPAQALREAREHVDKDDEYSVTYVTTPRNVQYLVFIPKLPRKSTPKQVSLALRIAVGLIAGLLFSMFLAWHLTRPIRKLRSATRQLAEGNLDTRVLPGLGRRRDEISDLAEDFDHMATKLQQTINAQKQLLHDVSHELRSPLARMQVAIGLSRQDKEKTAASLKRIEKEIIRLESLITDILALSRLDAGTGDATLNSVDLKVLLDEITTDARYESPDSDIRIFDEVHTLELTGSPELLRRAIENIIRNALKHAGDSAQITISTMLDVTHKDIRIQICDNGPGVPAVDIDRIFDPFYCADGDKQGTGLGLAIARRAIILHHGSIKASNNNSGGLCITISLPSELNL